MPPIWWYKSLQKLILDKKNIQNQKNVFVNFFFLVSIFAKHWYNEEKKRKLLPAEIEKKNRKNKQTRKDIKIQIKKWKQKKIVVLEVERRRKKNDKMAVTFVNLTSLNSLIS